VGLTDDVRRSCAEIAESARYVTIDLDGPLPSPGVSGLDPDLHRLGGPPDEVARYVLILDSINFGSGWFDELGTDTNALTARIEPWTDLLELSEHDTARRLALPPGHDLTRLYTRALNDLGAWLGDRWVLDVIATGSAQAMAASLLEMPLYADPGFYKRAQITANDLALAGVAAFADADLLTVFADNLVPHVLRVDGMLVYAPELAAKVDAGAELAAGSEMETEVRACAVHACELLSARWGVAPRLLDNWLWNRGQGAPYTDTRPHRTRTVFY
jgi:hypothetical protein